MVRVNLNTYYKTALDLHQSGKLEEARKLYLEILKLSPKHIESRFMLGQTFYEQGNFEKAIEQYHAGLKIKPEGLNLLIQLAASYVKTDKTTEAIKILENGIEKTGNPQLKLNLGIVKSQAELVEEAIAVFESIGINNIESDKALFHFARSYQLLNKIHESVEVYEKCLLLNPKNYGALNNLANLYQKLGEYQKAIPLYNNLISYFPNEAMGYNNLAGLYEKLNEHEKSIRLYQKAISLDSTLGIAWYNLAYLFFSQKSSQKETLDICSQGLAKVTGSFLQGLRYLQILTKQHVNDWNQYKKDSKDLAEIIENYLIDSNPVFEIVPYDLSYLKIENSNYKRVTEYHSNRISKKIENQFPTLSYDHSLSDGKVKVGYYSPNFKRHPGGYLVRKLFDHHDNSEFEIHAFSLLKANDAVQSEIRDSVDYYHDISDLSSMEISNLINRLGIDILVALGDYNEHMNMEVLAMRPAPIQMKMVGSHQTSGAKFINYTFSDSYMMDEKLRSHFSENIITLPISLLLNSELIEVAIEATSKSAHNLPADKFIFASFNHPKKNDPETFDCWIEILKKTPNSILWLYDAGSEITRENISTYLSKNDISADRIVFAGPIKTEQHLERLKHADLFLDTFNYNAHFTAIEILRSGKPILALKGNNHNSRLCSSMLHYAALDSLITESSKSYVDRAIQLYKNKSELKEIEQKLAQKDKKPLFDTEMQVRFLEKAFKLAIHHYKKTGQYEDLIVKSSLKFDAFSNFK